VNDQGNRAARRAWASALKRHAKSGGVFHVDIRHEPGCGIYTAARLCNCSPDHVVKDDKGRVLAAVAGAGFYDPLEFAGAVQ
jgi:hypothetical protein